MKKKRVIVFGIFDGVHEGHRKMFEQALAHGNELVAVVGRDSSVLELKHKTPKFSEVERMQQLKGEPLVSKAVLGDKKLSSYKILEKLKPNAICLGYDQRALGNDLAQWLKKKNSPIKIFVLKPHKPRIFHNSKINSST